VIGIDLIGIGDLLGKIDFNQLVKPLKSMVSTTTMQFALGFKAIKEIIPLRMFLNLGFQYSKDSLAVLKQYSLDYSP
jgi:hypothetical protein